MTFITLEYGYLVFWWRDKHGHWHITKRLPI